MLDEIERGLAPVTRSRSICTSTSSSCSWYAFSQGVICNIAHFCVDVWVQMVGSCVGGWVGVCVVVVVGVAGVCLYHRQVVMCMVGLWCKSSLCRQDSDERVVWSAQGDEWQRKGDCGMFGSNC